jgi:hypothetical protein
VKVKGRDLCQAVYSNFLEELTKIFTNFSQGSHNLGQIYSFDFPTRKSSAIANTILWHTIA